MEMLFISIVVLIIAAISSRKKKRRPYNRFSRWQAKKPAHNFKYEPTEQWPYIEKRLLTPVETKLFFRLKEALPEHHIFAQVQLSQLVEVRKGHDYQQWLNRISRMSADFVVADSRLKTIAVIELDDSSHKRPDRIEADQKKDKALETAGLRVIRWKTWKMPTTEGIRAEFNQPINEEKLEPTFNDVEKVSKT